MGGQSIIPGGIIEKPAPLPISNVMVVCPVCKKPTRVGVQVHRGQGRENKVRVCKQEGCGQELDG